VDSLTEKIADLCAAVEGLPLDQKIEALNQIREALHGVSPFKAEPVDCVVWVKAEKLKANNYNPNAVAPVEMQLLERSIEEDGYTQPIVAHGDGIVDGFHRNRVGKECPRIKERIHGYLPTVQVNASQTDQSNRMASTIRHNRARGTHNIDLMCNVVAELKSCGMSDQWIIKQIGMDADELLRLKQITGLAEAFKGREFSKSWT
jgi:ParB-like chromosome segregation protein Spo0J